ncbi:MAG: hypothetical protein V3T58_03545 [Candidatus Hydrothermarchaeales archaeon]
MRYGWIFLVLVALALAIPASALQIITDGTTIIIGNETWPKEGYYTVEHLSVTGVLGPDGLIDFSGDVNVRGAEVAVSLFFNVEDIGVASLFVDGEAAQIFFTPDKGYFFVADEGQHSIKGTAKVREKSLQENRVPLGIMGPVIVVDMDLEIRGADDKYIHISSPVEGTKTAELGSTRYQGEFYGVANKTLVIEWQEKGYKPEEAPTIPKIFTRTVSQVHFTETEVLSDSHVVYDSYNQEITSLRIRIIGDILSVSSKTEIQWETVVEDGKTVLVVTPVEAVTHIEIDIKTQLTPGDYPTSFRIDYPVVADDVTSQDCYFVVSSDPEISVKTTPHEFRETILNEVPYVVEKKLKAIAFKGVPTGYFDFEVQKLEIMPVITASADYGRYTHVVLEDGGILSDVTWQVKNTAEEYMFVKLPEESTLFYVGIDGKSVKPTKSEGELAIPLKRSQRTYPIEVIYYNPNEVGFAGRAELPLPTTGIPISNLEIGGYIPRDTYFLGAETNLHTNTQSDFPEWRSMVMFLVFLLIISYFFAHVAVKEEHRKRFAGLATVFLYFLNIFHAGLFAILVVFALGYSMKQYLSIKRGEVKWVLAAAAVVLIILVVIYALGSISRSAGARLEYAQAPAMEQEVASLAIMEEKLAKEPSSTPAPTVPTKKGVEGVRLLVPTTGRYVSFSAQFETLDKTPSIRIYHINKDIIYLHYLLAIFLGYLAYIRFLSWRQVAARVSED